MNIDAPEGWHWGIGSRIGENCYTGWLYTDRVLHPTADSRGTCFGYEAEIYSDPNQPHTVNFYQYKRWNPNGDNDIGEHPVVSRQFDSEEKARTFAVEKAAELR